MDPEDYRINSNASLERVGTTPQSGKSNSPDVKRGQDLG